MVEAVAAALAGLSVRDVVVAVATVVVLPHFRIPRNMAIVVVVLSVANSSVVAVAVGAALVNGGDRCAEIVAVAVVVVA